MCIIMHLKLFICPNNLTQQFFILLIFSSSYNSECQPMLDPMLSMYNPSCYFGAVSELFRKNVKDYMECDPDHRLVDDDDDDKDDDDTSGNHPK